MGSQHAEELSVGDRFAFGDNWSRFLSLLDDERIALAKKSLCQMLDTETLQGKRFLDIGSGSGLFSLVARQLGAFVYSFDYDPQSVACTRALKDRYYPNDADWIVDEGSILDQDYLAGIGYFDIVYSWGVLHHTGNMWRALENAGELVDDQGKLYIAIYNDQGPNSQHWLKIKKTYNRLPRGLRWLVLWPAALRLWGPTTVRDFLSGRPFATWRNYSKAGSRGMDPWRDVVDWVGGLPFEVASPEAIFRFFRDKGYSLQELVTSAGGHGCNEFVFSR